MPFYSHTIRSFKIRRYGWVIESRFIADASLVIPKALR